MNRLLQILAIPCALLLALPPGWCHAGVLQADVESAASCCCCHQMPAGDSAGSDGAPVKPAVRCCCPHEAMRPEKPVQTDDGAALVADVAPAGSAAVPACPQAASIDPLNTARPLRTLQCIWRC